MKLNPNNQRNQWGGRGVTYDTYNLKTWTGAKPKSHYFIILEGNVTQSLNTSISHNTFDTADKVLMAKSKRTW